MEISACFLLYLSRSLKLSDALVLRESLTVFSMALPVPGLLTLS